MAAQLRLNDLVTSAAGSPNFGTSETPIMSATQPEPDPGQEATVILFTINNLHDD